MIHWPHRLENEEVIWLRQQRRERTQLRGVYVALTEAINVERALKGKPLTTRNAVFSAVVGNSFKHLDEPPVETNKHYRPNKLTRKQVREIIQLLDQKPQLTTVAIAKRYGVTQEAISKINSGSNHRWATKGQSIAKRLRHREVKLSKEDLLCLLRCAVDREWWTYDVLAEIFGLTSVHGVKNRLREARKRHRRLHAKRDILFDTLSVVQ